MRISKMKIVFLHLLMAILIIFTIAFSVIYVEHQYDTEIYSIFGFENFSYGAEESPIKVQIDGKEIEFDVPPILLNGRTLLPLRKIFTELKGNV